MSFVHLHTHSHFSLLDGLVKPEAYVKRAAELEQPALALTDHGSLSGLFQLWKYGQANGVKPIAGCEFYIAPEGRFRKEAVRWGNENQRDADISGSGAYGHITILAEDAEGLRNLYRLQDAAYREGFYRKPRIDIELLHNYRRGLICLTGCPGGLLSTNIRLDRFEQARVHLQELKDIFGEDLYIEIMSHGIDFEEKLNAALLSLANDCETSIVATGDSHYCYKDDASAHQALLCVQTKSILDSPKFQFAGSGYHLASYDEMRLVFEQAGLPYEALHVPLELSQKIESYNDVFEPSSLLPEWPGNVEQDLQSILSQYKIDNGIQFGDDRYQRLEYETDTLLSLGFADYLLVVADIMAEARRREIRVGPGRGSAAGSLVCYALGITTVDPISCDLLFERFINPDRAGLPDIDIDIQEDRREEFVNIAREKYGKDHVAQLGTFGTVGAKAALKDSARVLGYPYKIGEERTKCLPFPKFGHYPGLDEYTGEKDEIYDLATRLEGCVRSESIHSAGVIISPRPLSEIIPLRIPGGKGENVAAYDMHEIEALGFAKTDFLGLKTLKVIDDCLHMLESSFAEKLSDTFSYRQIELPTAPAECTDPATYELLARGDTIGVFQLDGSGMRGLLRQMVPDSFSDIAAVLALYRPGPMGVKADRDYALRKNGRQRISYIHRELEAALEPILEETYGLIVYQEQVLKVLAAVGDYTYGSAELIFNAMRKKQVEKMEAAKPDFVCRMRKKGYTENSIQVLWDTLVPFADYSFNKAHSTAYGLISYWTAFLKANYPKQWMAALLSNEDKPEKLPEYLSECWRMGIEILPPDVNESGVAFTPTDQGIRYGLASIKGVGIKAVNAIRSKGPYTSLEYWYRKAPSAALNGGVLNALVRSGALDSLCSSREGHLGVYEKLAERARSERKSKSVGQRGVVKARYLVPRAEYISAQRRLWEKETLGTQLSTGTIVITPTTLLQAAEIEWLKQVIEAYPGNQPCVIDFDVTTIDTGLRVNLVQAKASLLKLGKIKIREQD